MASFTGAFHCPVATEFCSYETISGIKYPEFQPYQVWILVGIFVGIPGLLFLICLFPCFREPLVRRLKSWYDPTRAHASCQSGCVRVST